MFSAVQTAASSKRFESKKSFCLCVRCAVASRDFPCSLILTCLFSLLLFIIAIGFIEHALIEQRGGLFHIQLSGASSCVSVDYQIGNYSCSNRLLCSLSLSFSLLFTLFFFFFSVFLPFARGETDEDKTGSTVVQLIDSLIPHYLKPNPLADPTLARRAVKAATVSSGGDRGSGGAGGKGDDHDDGDDDEPFDPTRAKYHGGRQRGSVPLASDAASHATRAAAIAGSGSGGGGSADAVGSGGGPSAEHRGVSREQRPPTVAPPLPVRSSSLGIIRSVMPRPVAAATAAAASESRAASMRGAAAAKAIAERAAHASSGESGSAASASSQTPSAIKHSTPLNIPSSGAARSPGVSDSPRSAGAESPRKNSGESPRASPRALAAMMGSSGTSAASSSADCNVLYSFVSVLICCFFLFCFFSCCMVHLFFENSLCSSFYFVFSLAWCTSFLKTISVFIVFFFLFCFFSCMVHPFCLCSLFGRLRSVCTNARARSFRLFQLCWRTT